MTLGSKKHQNDDTKKKPSPFVKVPSRFFWPIFAILIGGSDLADHGITALFPMRGDQKVQQFQDKTTTDNHNLLVNVAAAQVQSSNADREILSRISEKEAEDTKRFENLQRAIDRLDSRVDALFSRQSNKQASIPSLTPSSFQTTLPP
jgi:hypothetical protein